MTKRGTSTSYIYLLLDPRSGEPRYVGQSVCPSNRFATHLRDARGGADFRCHRWLRTLGERRPFLLVVEDAARGDEIDAAEQWWVRHLREAGLDLTNLNDGGSAKKGGTISAAHIEALAAANRGKQRPPEVRARIKAALNRPETKARLRAVQLGNKSRSGQKQTEAERERRAAANRGKKRSPEFCEAVRQRMLGTTRSEESRVKQSVTRRSQRERL